MLGNIFLLLVLIFGKEINGTRAWFSFKFISFQPSEIMKFYLLLLLSSYTSKLNNIKIKNVLIMLLIVIIPGVLTFLEPDTGAVIMYFLIFIGVLMASKLKKIYLIYFLIGIVLLLSGIFIIYFLDKSLFIKIFSSNMFYRMERILDFKTQTGYQIENALISITNSGYLGYGISNHPIYFPEAPTDFVFDLTISSFGILTGILVVIVYLLLIFNNFKIYESIDSYENKLFVFGFLIMFIINIFYNILMNIGLLPIMGITLPFISYGGSSIIVNFIILGLISGLNKKRIKSFLS